MLNPPWTGLGRVEADIDSIKSDLHNKVSNHELASINSRLDRLEDSVREIRAACDGMESRLRTLEENSIALPDAQEEWEIEVEPMRNYDPTESIRQTRKSIDEWIAKKVDK